MQDYKQQIEEFNVNITSTIDESVRELSMTFDKLYDERNSKDIPTAIKTAKALLSVDHNIPTKMQLYYDIANAFHDLRVIQCNEEVEKEHYLEKEIYYLRCALDLFENNYTTDESDSAEVKVSQYIAMRSYTNLGNAYQAIGPIYCSDRLFAKCIAH